MEFWRDGGTNEEARDEHKYLAQELAGGQFDGDDLTKIGRIDSFSGGIAPEAIPDRGGDAPAWLVNLLACVSIKRSRDDVIASLELVVIQRVA